MPGMSVTQPVGHFPELGTLLLWEWGVAFSEGTVPPRCPWGELDMAVGTVLEVRCPQGQVGSALGSSLVRIRMWDGVFIPWSRVSREDVG